MADDVKAAFRRAVERATVHLQEALGQLRTDRATPALVEKVQVVAYGTTQTVKAVASISVADAGTLVIQAWDPALGPSIGKAIAASPLGVNPTVEGATVRVTLPMLTAERRNALLKVLSEKREAARIAVRAARDEALRTIREGERSKSLSEDAASMQKREIEKAVEEANARIEHLVSGKQRELEPA